MWKSTLFVLVIRVINASNQYKAVPTSVSTCKLIWIVFTVGIRRHNSMQFIAYMLTQHCCRYYLITIFIEINTLWYILQTSTIEWFRDDGFLKANPEVCITRAHSTKSQLDFSIEFGILHKIRSANKHLWYLHGLLSRIISIYRQHYYEFWSIFL